MTMRKSTALLLLAAATATLFVILSGGASAAEPNDNSSTAEPLAPGLNGPFDIDPTYDEDWYAFSLVDISAVSIWTNGSSGNTMLYLYDANISTITYSYSWNYSTWSRINYVLPPGVYYAVVSSYYSTQIYNYTITLQVQTSAVPMALGFNGYNASDDLPLIFWTFDVTEESSVRLYGNNATGNPDVYLFDQNGSLYAYNANSGPGLNPSLTSQLYPATWFVLIFYDPTYGGSYGGDIFLTIISLLGADGNGIIGNATLLALGPNGPFDIDAGTDLDWYTITFAADAIAEFEVDGPGPGYPVLSFYDENGSWLGQLYDSNHFLFQAYVEARQYFVLVQDLYGYYTFLNYTVNVSVAAVPPPDANDVFTDADPLGDGTASGFSLVQYDEDWYTYFATIPGYLRVETNGRAGGAAVYLLDSDQAYIATGYGTGNYSFEVAQVLVEGGTYWIRIVLPYGPLATLDYNITITFTPYDSLDQNDFRSQAERLVPGLNGPFRIVPSTDIDWYFIDVVDAGRILVELFGGGGYGTMSLHNATGYQLLGGVYGTIVLNHSATAGRYFVRASGYNNINVVDNYYLNLTLPDSTPPVLALSGPVNGAQVDTGSTVVAGTTEPGARVWVNGQEIVVDINGSFSTVILVPLGTSNITVVTRDLRGNEDNVSLLVIGVSHDQSLQNQLDAANAALAATQGQVSSAQAQLAAAQAATAAEAAARAQANATLLAKQQELAQANGTIAAARLDADAQRGAALFGMVFAVLGVVGGIGLAIMMRKRPGSPQSTPAPYTPPAQAPVVVAVPPTPPTPEAPPAPVTPPSPPPAAAPPAQPVVTATLNTWTPNPPSPPQA